MVLLMFIPVTALTTDLWFPTAPSDTTTTTLTTSSNMATTGTTATRGPILGYNVTLKDKL